MEDAAEQAAKPFQSLFGGKPKQAKEEVRFWPQSHPVLASNHPWRHAEHTQYWTSRSQLILPSIQPPVVVLGPSQQIKLHDDPFSSDL